MNRRNLLLILILLLGTFLRFHSLDKESFWADEGATGMAIKKYTAQQILNNVIGQGQFLPDYYSYDDDLPLYYILLKGWTGIFGISDYSLRSFSAFFGSLSLILVFYLAEYLFDKKVAIFSTFLASVNMIMLWYSQESRQYSYLLFLSLLSSILLLKFLREKKLIFAVGLVITNGFIVYTHFPWVMFITFEGAYALYFIYLEYNKKKKPSLKTCYGAIAAFSAIGLMYLTIISRALTSHTDTISIYGRPGIVQMSKFTLQLSSWIYPSESMLQKIYNFSMDFTFFEWILIFSVVWTSIILTILFIFQVARNYKKESVQFLCFMFFIPLIFALILSYAHPIFTVFQIKQLIYIIPVFLILAAAGCLKTKHGKALIILITILSLTPLYAYYENTDKTQFREAAEFLKEKGTVLIHNKSAEATFEYYYGEAQNVRGVANVSELKSTLKDANSIWMLFTLKKYLRDEMGIKKELSMNYEITATKNFYEIELIHYKKR